MRMHPNLGEPPSVSHSCTYFNKIIVFFAGDIFFHKKTLFFSESAKHGDSDFKTETVKTKKAHRVESESESEASENFTETSEDDDISDSDMTENEQ